MSTVSEKHNDSNSPLLIVGALIVGYGVVRLLPLLLGPWWNHVSEYATWASRLSQPLLLILLGVIFVYLARRGGFTGSSGKLTRSRHDRRISGVAGGFASYLGIDSTIVRLALIAIVILGGWWLVFVVYVGAVIIVPEERA